MSYLFRPATGRPEDRGAAPPRYRRLRRGRAAGREAPATAASVAWDSEQAGRGRGRATFDLRFAEATELVGHTKLRVWMSAAHADDLDVFVALQKLDRYGDLVGFPFYAVFEDGPVALGWIRASHRNWTSSDPPPGSRSWPAAASSNPGPASRSRWISRSCRQAPGSRPGKRSAWSSSTGTSTATPAAGAGVPRRLGQPGQPPGAHRRPVRLAPAGPPDSGLTPHPGRGWGGRGHLSFRNMVLAGWLR